MEFTRRTRILDYMILFFLFQVNEYTPEEEGDADSYNQLHRLVRLGNVEYLFSQNKKKF